MTSIYIGRYIYIKLILANLFLQSSTVANKHIIIIYKENAFHISTDLLYYL